MDNQRAVTLLYILAGIAGGLFVRSAAADIALANSLNDVAIAGVVSVSTTLGILSAIGVFFGLNRHVRSTEFVESAVAELDRISWPSREETLHNTGIVIGTALGFGLLMFVYDSVWSKVAHLALYSGTPK